MEESIWELSIAKAMNAKLYRERKISEEMYKIASESLQKKILQREKSIKME